MTLTAQVLAMVWGGAVSDRRDRRTLLLYSNVAMMLSAVVLAVYVGAGLTDPVLIIALTTVTTAFFGLQQPMWQSLATGLVPRDAAENAAHATVMKFQAARATGPLLGGALLAGPGAAWALGFNSLTFLFAIAAILRIGRPAPEAFAAHPAADGQRPGYLGVIRQPVIGLAVALTATVAVLGLPIVQLTTVLADETYHVDAAAYGVLLSAFGFGSLLGALTLTAWHHPLQRSRTVAVSMAGFGTALLVAGLTQTFWIGVVAVSCAASVSPWPRAACTEPSNCCRYPRTAAEPSPCISSRCGADQR